MFLLLYVVWNQLCQYTSQSVITNWAMQRWPLATRWELFWVCAETVSFAWKSPVDWLVKAVTYDLTQKSPSDTDSMKSLLRTCVIVLSALTVQSLSVTRLSNSTCRLYSLITQSMSTMIVGRLMWTVNTLCFLLFDLITINIPLIFIKHLANSISLPLTLLIIWLHLYLKRHFQWRKQQLWVEIQFRLSAQFIYVCRINRIININLHCHSCLKNRSDGVWTKHQCGNRISSATFL